MKTKGKIVIGVIVAAVIAVAGGYWFYTQQNEGYMLQCLNTNTIYPNISIDGVAVGGLTKEEALELLGHGENVENKEIVFVTSQELSSEVIGSFTYADIDAKKDIVSAVEQAYGVARSEADVKSNYKIYKQVEDDGYDVKSEMAYSNSKLDAFITQLDVKASKEAKDSTATMVDGQFVIEDEVYGFEMDEDEVKVQVISMLDKYASGEVIVTGSESAPSITREDNEKITNLLGSFTTKYTGGESLGRNINLKVGCEHITGTIVAPGEIFSMNEGLGEQTYAGGYRNAAVIVNGKLEDGIAGGVCQITTTLYNAVVKAELEIVERSNHSLAVAYVPMGQDAAVAGTYKDFKFKNTTDYPIYIDAYAKNGQLVTNVYGYETRSSSREVTLEHVYIGSYAKPPEKVTPDPELPEGEREVTFEGKVGHKVSTYKVVYENGDFVSREWFNDSVYSAVADEVKVGTGPKVEDTENQEVGGLPGIIGNEPTTDVSGNNEGGLSEIIEPNQNNDEQETDLPSDVTEENQQGLSDVLGELENSGEDISE